MDIVGTSLSAAQTLLALLQCPQLKDIPEIIGYKSQLEDLKNTVESVTAVLRDAERKQNDLPEQTQLHIEKLKDAVFEADDLLDEFVTLSEQKRILKVEGGLAQGISSFFSSSNTLSVALRMWKGVKKIRKKLDGIVYNKQLNFEHDPEPIRKLDRETCSYVNEVDIIGRDDDLERIVSMLLDDSNVQRDDLSFLAIVGIGGLGKTALAQLVFNNKRVADAFPLRLWTCVADQDHKQLNVTEILHMILASATDKDIDRGSTLDQIQRKLRQQLEGKRYLLILDDVWTEDRQQWCELIKYLIGGARGSWIVVTTRSQVTATIICGEEYKLQGLSQDNSWHLFEKTAFASDQSNPPNDLVDIGRKIVDGCAGAPLAIRVAGSLLYGQEKSKWLLVQNNGCAHTRDNENTIMPIMKLSYHHLASPLKSCFTYCALFPKDYRIQKETLIELWMAQGYIVPLDYGQSIADAAEEYFSILLKRCFFQDIQKDTFGEIESFKIHDLMHDIAQIVSRKEILALNSSTSSNIDNIKVRHLSISGKREYRKYPLGMTKIRSLLFVDHCLADDNSEFLVEALVAKFKWLRALDLSNLRIKILPRSIGELMHLRYLDLSFNSQLEMLPKSITKLCNLQTLKLACCFHLKELPKDLSRLVKLRVLDIENCSSLAYMPRSMGKLSSLARLKGWYILGGEGNNCSSWKEWFYGLEDLNVLNNLKGILRIKIRWPENAKVRMEEDSWSWREGLNSCLKGMEHLNYLFIFLTPNNNGTMMRLLMEELQPPSKLKVLQMLGYEGVKMPGWFSNATSLPYLMDLYLGHFEELEYLPLLFPSLKKMGLVNMLKLRGVGVEESSSSSGKPESQRLLLPHLSKLTITHCPKLACLRIMAPQLWEFGIDTVACLSLDSIPMESLKCLQFGNNGRADLPNWIQYYSSLEYLNIYHCLQLQSIPSWMSKLTNLKTFILQHCSEQLKRRCQKDPPGEDWPYIQHIPDLDISAIAGLNIQTSNGTYEDLNDN